MIGQGIHQLLDLSVEPFGSSFESDVRVSSRRPDLRHSEANLIHVSRWSCAPSAIARSSTIGCLPPQGDANAARSAEPQSTTRARVLVFQQSSSGRHGLGSLPTHQTRSSRAHSRSRESQRCRMPSHVSLARDTTSADMWALAAPACGASADTAAATGSSACSSTQGRYISCDFKGQWGGGRAGNEACI